MRETVARKPSPGNRHKSHIQLQNFKVRVSDFTIT